MESEGGESELVHCIYCSAATQPMSPEALTALLAIARAKNQRLGISGMLLFADGSFFQVLEGEAEGVDALYATIARDPRHHKVTKVIREPIAQRHFKDWTMGLLMLTRAELAQIDGSNDFFSAGRCFTELDSGRAKKLLAAFREGRWRQSITG